jgi:hypothetical protein
MKRRSKITHVFALDGKALATVTYTVIRDGLNNTVKFPNKGDMVTINETLYIVIAIHHDFDVNFISYHLSIPKTEP